MALHALLLCSRSLGRLPWCRLPCSSSVLEADVVLLLICVTLGSGCYFSFEVK